MGTSQPMHMSPQPVQMTSQPIHIPTIGGMQPISTSAYQPGFFGGTGSAVFQGSGGVVVEGSGTAMFAGQGATAFGGEGSAHFQFDDNTVFVQSVEGGGFVGIAEGDGQATFVGQGIAAGVGNGLVGFGPYPQNRYPQPVATPYRPSQQTYQPAYYTAPYYNPAPVYYY